MEFQRDPETEGVIIYGSVLDQVVLWGSACTSILQGCMLRRLGVWALDIDWG